MLSFMDMGRCIRKIAPVGVGILWSFCLLLFVWETAHSLDRSVMHLARTALVQGSTHFAIADFDGDLQPDLAMVRVARDGAPFAEYFVDLKFSTGRREPLGILGPAGGLEITPKDVNGDKLTDLVVTSQFDAKFLAVFLNDGKGNFRQAERSEFPQLGSDCPRRLSAPEESPVVQFVLGRARTVDGEGPLSTIRAELPNESHPLGNFSARVARSRWTLSRSGRAPPFV